MSETYAQPKFGGQRRTADYYRQIDAIIATLRPTASQRTIADHLNKCGFTTPRSLPWDRQRLANYLRGTSI